MRLIFFLNYWLSLYTMFFSVVACLFIQLEKKIKRKYTFKPRGEEQYPGQAASIHKDPPDLHSGSHAWP